MKCDDGLIVRALGGRGPLVGTGLALAALILLLAVSSLGTLFVPAQARAEITVFDVGEKLMCQCGCEAVLTSCPHQECGWGVPNKQFIGEQLDGGRTSAEIIQYYVGQYGEEVLAAPTKTGFNIAAWVTPFIGLVVGAVAIYYLVSLWVRRRGGAAPLEEASVSESAVSPDRLERLERELKEFD